LTEIGSKWSKKKKRLSEVRESKPFNKEIEDDRSIRKMDHGQLSKRKKMSTSALENLTKKKER
jgi:hypothetical protein